MPRQMIPPARTSFVFLSAADEASPHRTAALRYAEAELLTDRAGWSPWRDDGDGSYRTTAIGYGPVPRRRAGRS